MWLFREVSSPYLFILAQIDPDIKWRSHSFRVKFGGIAELKEQVNIFKKLINSQSLFIFYKHHLFVYLRVYLLYFSIKGSVMILLPIPAV
jgi:hypothetical protein